jgi:hypothetical protein
MFGNTTTEVHQAAAQWQKLMVDTWSQWTAKTVSSESFAAASGAYMDWALSSQKMVAEMSGQMMETLDIPRRSDLARLAAQVQSVETRLLDQEETNEEIRDLLVALNSKLDRLASTSSATPAVPEVAPAAPPDAAAAVKEAVSRAAREVEVAKTPGTSRKPTKKGKKSA